MKESQFLKQGFNDLEEKFNSLGLKKDADMESIELSLTLGGVLNFDQLTILASKCMDAFIDNNRGKGKELYSLLQDQLSSYELRHDTLKLGQDFKQLKEIQEKIGKLILDSEMLV